MRYIRMRRNVSINSSRLVARSPSSWRRCRPDFARHVRALADACRSSTRADAEFSRRGIFEIPSSIVERASGRSTKMPRANDRAGWIRAGSMIARLLEIRAINDGNRKGGSCGSALRYHSQGARSASEL